MSNLKAKRIIDFHEAIEIERQHRKLNSQLTPDVRVSREPRTGWVISSFSHVANNQVYLFNFLGNIGSWNECLQKSKVFEFYADALEEASRITGSHKNITLHPVELELSLQSRAAKHINQLNSLQDGLDGEYYSDFDDISAGLIKELLDENKRLDIAAHNASPWP